MQKTNKKKQAQRTSGNLTKSAHDIAVRTDRNSHLAPTLCLEPSSTFSVANNSRGTHFIFGPVARAAAVTALRLAQIETQVQIALQQLATLVTVTVGNRCHNNSEFSATLPPHLVLLSLLNRQQVSALGFNVDSNSKTYTNAQPRVSAAMYHNHSQQQGQQPFSNGPRPPHHQPPPNQHQNRPPSDMLSQVMGFQFPRPTQLPDELESALAIRGARDMDHRLIDHMNRPNQHQNQSSGSGIRQHGNYGSNPVTLTSDNQPGHQQGVDWSSYQPPTKLFASPPPNTSHQSQRHQGPQQQPQGSHAGAGIPNWTAPISDSPSPQAQHPHGGGSGGGGENQGLYTPESAGSILASFGLSNEDLEVLSHYPDDQLTPDTLPFILRDIQINKSGSQKPVTSSSSSSFSRSVHEMPLPASRSSPLGHSSSPEVPSLLTVTQTAGKVIDYGHASRAKDENSTRETFKREPLSNERTVKMYPTSSSSSSALKVDKPERRQVRLEQTESSKHGDRDYRRTSSDHRKSNRSPGRDFMPSSKSRNLDRDYRHDGPKPRPLSETRSEASSRRSLSSSSGSKPHSSSKKLPTPTMISDFSAASPKVYPHTCSLCHIQCDQEKDWVDHVNTVNHTAACRDLRNKYPDWKPNLPRPSGQYGSQPSWHPSSPSHSASRSLSCSLSPSPPHRKHRVGPHTHRPHGRHYSPQHHPRHQHYTEGFSRSGLKRPYDDSTRSSAYSSRHPSSSKAGHGSKYGPFQSTRPVKSGTKPATKTTKVCAKPPPAKKKKKVVTPASQDSSVADRLVYLTGIPKDASEQEVTDLVGSFGKINNVILMPCSEEESEKGEGQKASVCMVKAEDAQALANSINLSIRDQQITASVAKKPDSTLKSSEANNGKPAPGQDKSAAGDESTAGGEADQKTSDEKGVILITGLPESDWSESDIIKLVQPYGTPSDVIMATQIGKVLVSLPDSDIAQEIVKVHSFVPAKMNDSELKIIHLKQCISLSTPVALYNLLMGALDPLESPAPVGWSSLLVISNVPSTPSGSSEVQKLVRRFGTVIKTLVLNNMVICEMATAAMALSVYKRFQTFPCIIQNNPLFFSRKADPKASTQTKVISAYLDSSEDTPANGKSSQTAASADEEETVHKDESEPPLEGVNVDGDEKEKKTRSGEETVCKDEASEENTIKNDSNAVSDSAAVPDTKPKADLETAVKEISAGETVMETTEEKTCVPKTGNAKTPPGEETKPSSSDTAVPELPKVTQEMVNALLVECRTRTAGQPSNGEEEEETQVEAEQGEKAVDETKEPADHTEEEEEAKRQERERKEREARKEKETRERKERERRAWEKEERAKKERERSERARRERERREEERREWERRDRERRERKRTYKQSSWRDEQHNSSEAEPRAVEEEFDEFPFNMSDFVTVDEVGDVTDLPCSPSPSAPMATTEGGEDDPTSVQQEAAGDTPMEVATETAPSDAPVTTVKSDGHVSESEAVTVPAAETANQMSSHLTPPTTAAPPSPASQSESAPQTHTCDSETPKTETTPETETTLTATLDSTTDVEPPASAASPAPAESSSNSPASQEVTTAAEKDRAPSHNQAKTEEVVPDEVKEQKKTQDEEDKERETDPSCFPVRETEESAKKKLEKEAVTDCSLPPFDPRNPVGMEFLVPKTGFFCKVCNRFFSGAKEAEINHCKTLKHYDNLQKYLQTTKTANGAAKPDSS